MEKRIQRNISMAIHDTVFENIQNNYEALYAAEAKVADFILKNPMQALEANVSETAELSGVSDATVVRFCKRIGYAGFYQMKLQLSLDMGKNVNAEQNEQIQKPDSAQERVRSIGKNIELISKHVDTELMKKCAAMINRSNTVFVIGNGYAKIIACDIIYRLTRMGIRCSGGGYAETDFENLYMGQKNDVAIFISRSGEDKKSYNEMKMAQKRGIITISLTDAIKCPMGQIADYSLTTGIENRAKVQIHENSSSLNMMVLTEVLLGYVVERNKNKSYLNDVISEDRL